jgi:hypothetical protein
MGAPGWNEEGEGGSWVVLRVEGGGRKYYGILMRDARRL